MMKKRTIFYAVFTAVVAVVIFCVRRGFERPFFALTDALTLGGFFGLLFSYAPSVISSDAFDGFSYAFSFVAAGLFPRLAKGYSAFKKEREVRRGERAKRGYEWLTPAVFFLFGMIFSLFFL